MRRIRALVVVLVLLALAACGRSGLVPVPPPTIVTVEYTPGLLLDVYPLPGSGHGGIVIVHGGGWTRGSRADPEGAAIRSLLAAEGYVVFSIDYRLAPQHPYPAAVDDTRTALAWVTANAGTYGVDPSRVYLLGTSAGGHLALLVSVTGDVRPRGVVSFYGPTDLRGSTDPQVLAFLGGADPAEASPITYVSPDDPSALLLHGTADAKVPYAQATAYAQASGAQLVTIAGGIHDYRTWPHVWETPLRAWLASH